MWNALFVYHCRRVKCSPSPYSFGRSFLHQSSNKSNVARDCSICCICSNPRPGLAEPGARDRVKWGKVVQLVAIQPLAHLLSSGFSCALLPKGDSYTGDVTIVKTVNYIYRQKHVQSCQQRL